MIDVTYPQMPIIETEKYILRPASLDDAEDMFEYYKQPKVVKYLPMNPHKSVANTKRFIKSFFIDNYNQGKIGHFAVVDKLNNKVIGNIGLNQPYTDNVNTTTKSECVYVKQYYTERAAFMENRLTAQNWIFRRK